MTKTILIVDDASSMRSLVALTLRNAGYQVVEASDGVDALNRIGKQKVNMVITDFNMPNMNGIDLIKALKSDPQHKFIPIVVLTTESETKKKLQGQMAGALAWVVKPFKPETILMVVKKTIG